jgi:hypothetical protein
VIPNLKTKNGWGHGLSSMCQAVGSILEKHGGEGEGEGEEFIEIVFCLSSQVFELIFVQKYNSLT